MIIIFSMPSIIHNLLYLLFGDIYETICPSCYLKSQQNLLYQSGPAS